MPTWFMHRNIFEKIGGFSNKGRGYPEDQEFILRHVFEFDGKLHRVEKVLLMYRKGSNLINIYNCRFF